MLQELINSLDALGKSTELSTTPDGSRILVLPYGGRVLGVFAPGNDENFLWTNPILNDVEAARAYYQADDWHNSGGDRTWLAPEVDFFLPDYPSLERYWQPRSLDPGSYKISRNAGQIQLTNQLRLETSRTKRSVELKITKSLAAAPNPLRYERVSAAGEIEYAGHTLITGLQILDPEPETAPLVGLWSLTQMPHRGELYIPTYFRSQPKVYFGLVGTPAEELTVTDHMVRFKMRAAGEHKIGVRAAAATGRIGYIYPAGTRWSLLVRSFGVNPSGEYADIPWTEAADVGYSTQACSVNSRWGEFSELEYHVPAIGGGTGLARVEDRSQLWAFRGERAQIESIAQHLLGSQIQIG